MQKFDLASHYSLLQAFDATGRRLFGSDWLGIEAWTQRSDDPADSQKAKAAVGEEIVQLKKSMDDLRHQINFAADDQQKETAQAKYLELSKVRRKAEDRFQHFPVDYDNWVSNHAAFRRKTKIDTLLMDAFAAGKLKIYYRGGHILSWEEWRGQPAFKIYLNLSMIRLPRRAGSGSGKGIVSSDRDASITPDNPYREPTRYAAFVNANEFSQWVSQFGETPETPGTLTPEAQGHAMFKKMVSDNAQAVLRKNECWLQCRASIPDLSKRAFDRIWNAQAPDSWKQSGRRPGA